jgi:hypothetical protein
MGRRWAGLVVGVAVGSMVAAACGGGERAATRPAQAGEAGGAGDAGGAGQAGGAGHAGAHPATDPPNGPRPLPVLPNGLLDPDGIDLGGVPGVSAEQQARAEELLQRSILVLPRWSDPAAAEADGFHSIGDGFTGDEHFIRWDWIEDDVLLDPEHPESLVYRVGPDGSRTLAAAMYLLPSTYTLETVPDLGGPLTQWHVHDNLCFTETDPARVIGLTSADGSCSVGRRFPLNPMIHVWIRPHPCGPFAALEGVAGGQILPGEERACDHGHGG